MIRRLRARWQTWSKRWICDHHWHAADAMILWRCCWCGKDVDGWPRDKTKVCHDEVETAVRWLVEGQ